jgi:hypothetical protein
MQQRYYDSELGVFLSVDPVTAYENPIGQFHRYRYADNNPYTFTDPDGRATCADKNCTTAYIDSKPAQANNVNPLPSSQQSGSLFPSSSSQNMSPVHSSDSGPTITFKNDVPGGASPNQPVTLETALMVEAAVVDSGVQSVNINSTTGGHSPPSNHVVGRAVDINRVNGLRVDSPEGAAASRGIQDAASRSGNIRENFGPSYNQKTQTPGGTARAVTSPRVVNSHRNHVHLSGQR